MSKIYRKAGLIFFFYSSDMNEPPHVHIEYKEGGTMKVWLKEDGIPTIAWVRAGMPQHKRNEALDIIEIKKGIFLDNWYEFKKTGKVH